jgi:hypothetical protein
MKRQIKGWIFNDDNYDPDLTNQFPSTDVLKDVEEHVSKNQLEESPFIFVTTDYLNKKEGSLSKKDKLGLANLLKFTIDKDISDKNTRSVYEEYPQIIKYERERAAYNNEKFWNLVLWIIGFSMFGIIACASVLSYLEKPIPEFFSTSIGALIGVFLTLFAGWTQNR